MKRLSLEEKDLADLKAILRGTPSPAGLTADEAIRWGMRIKALHAALEKAEEEERQNLESRIQKPEDGNGKDNS